jgi:DNA-binding response OmpR family regulator
MEQIKILLVDDEKEFVETLADRIELRDHKADVALNGEQALKKLDDQIPDVVVLDLKMPGIDGMEVLRRIRKAYPKVQVIMLTGHGSEKHEEEARKLGAFEYLQKPVDIETLMKKVKLAYKSKFERSMVAATFAEAGEFDTAKEILKEEDDNDNNKK